MSAALAQLIEAERERAETAAKSGVRSALSDAAGPSSSRDDLPTMFDREESAGEEQTVLSNLSPVAKLAESAVQTSSQVDLVGAIIREMEASASHADGAELKDGWDSEPVMPTRGVSSKPPPLPARASAAPRPASLPVPAPEFPQPPRADGSPDSAAEARPLDSQRDESQRRPLPRAAFPEWIGLSVSAADLDHASGRNQRAIRLGVGAAVVVVLLAIVWWLVAS